MWRFEFTSQSYLRDPVAALGRLRAAGPVVEVKFPIIGRTWITTTYELAGRVLKDSETFTMRKDGRVAGLRWWMPGWIRTLAVSMLTMDEPDHTRLRSIVDEAFRRRAVLDMEPRIFAIADELAADLFADGSPADLVVRYARRLPLSVICELLGLPRADRPRFIAWANNLTRLTGMVSFLRMLAGIGPMKRYLEGRLQAARETGGEGLIAELVRVEKEGGRISGQEMVAMVFLLLGAGSETTTHLISGSVYELTKDPEAARLARGGLEPRQPGDRGIPALRFARPVHQAPLHQEGYRTRRRSAEEGRPDHGHAGGGQHGPRSQPAPGKARSRHGNPTGTCRSARVFTSASVTSSPASKASVRWRPSSSAGRSSSWQCRQTPFAGGSVPASGPSKRFPSRSPRALRRDHRIRAKVSKADGRSRLAHGVSAGGGQR